MKKEYDISTSLQAKKKKLPMVNLESTLDKTDGKSKNYFTR